MWRLTTARRLDYSGRRRLEGSGSSAMATPRKDPKDKKKVGRKAFQPTDAQRAEVATLSAAGFLHEGIAKYIGIDPDTLSKHFKPELETAKMKLIGNAVSKLHAAVNKGEAWAICFTLKTQGKDMGWAERFEHTGKNGAPIPIDAENISDAQLDSLIVRIERRLSTGSAKG